MDTSQAAALYWDFHSTPQRGLGSRSIIKHNIFVLFHGLILLCILIIQSQAYVILFMKKVEY